MGDESLMPFVAETVEDADEQKGHRRHPIAAPHLTPRERGPKNRVQDEVAQPLRERG